MLEKCLQELKISSRYSSLDLLYIVCNVLYSNSFTDLPHAHKRAASTMGAINSYADMHTPCSLRDVLLTEASNATWPLKEYFKILNVDIMR